MQICTKWEQGKAAKNAAWAFAGLQPFRSTSEMNWMRGQIDLGSRQELKTPWHPNSQRKYSVTVTPNFLHMKTLLSFIFRRCLFSNPTFKNEQTNRSQLTKDSCWWMEVGHSEYFAFSVWLNISVVHRTVTKLHWRQGKTLILSFLWKLALTFCINVKRCPNTQYLVN